MPRWLVTVSLVTGVTLFVVPIITEPVGLLFPTWVLVTSVTLLVTRPGNEPDAEPAGQHGSS